MSEISPLPVVKEASDIEISFELSLPDGRLVEKTEEGETLRFTLGDGTFVRNLEEMLIGLELGTTAKLNLSKENAFGSSDPSNIQSLARSEFPPEMPLEVGHVIGFDSPTGEVVPGTIKAVSDESVLVDFSHPLADTAVLFTATIKAIHS